MNDMKKKCENMGLYALPWAGKILKLCPQHANAMVVIANAIGSPIQVETIMPYGKCMGKDDFTKEDNEDE